MRVTPEEARQALSRLDNLRGCYSDDHDADEAAVATLERFITQATEPGQVPDKTLVGFDYGPVPRGGG